jgi:NTP pyrophosphatase (non-canonical NTP hydrolase)
MEVSEFIDKFVKDPGLNSLLKGFASQFMYSKNPPESNDPHWNDSNRVLGRIVSECHENAKDKGFWENRHPAEAIALIHSELSELLEVFRREKSPFDNFGIMSDKEELGDTPHALEELADVAIRVFDMAGRYFTPIAFAQAVLCKMAYNKTRPPKHGKSF